MKKLIFLIISLFTLNSFAQNNIFEVKGIYYNYIDTFEIPKNCICIVFTSHKQQKIILCDTSKSLEINFKNVKDSKKFVFRHSLNCPKKAYAILYYDSLNYKNENYILKLKKKILFGIFEKEIEIIITFKEKDNYLIVNCDSFVKENKTLLWSHLLRKKCI